MIDPRQLTYLLAIDECGSFSRAAERLRVSQPALSSSIALLERRIGMSVLTRTPRGATVNDIGRQLALRARELQSVMNNAAEDVKLQKLGIAGQVSIGAAPALAEVFLPELIERLHSEGLEVSLTVLEARDDRLTQGLLERELDFVLTEVLQGPSDPLIAEEMLYLDPFFLAVGMDSPFADRDEIELGEVMSARWVLPMPGGSAYSDTHSLFRTASVGWPVKAIHTNSMALTKRLITKSIAIGMITGMMHANLQSSIRRISVRTAAPRKLGIKRLAKGETSDVLCKSLALAREVAAGFDTLGSSASPS